MLSHVHFSTEKYEVISHCWNHLFFLLWTSTNMLLIFLWFIVCKELLIKVNSIWYKQVSLPPTWITIFQFQVGLYVARSGPFDYGAALITRGLMYKDMRGFPTETWRTLKPKCPPTYKNIRRYQCVRTHESKHISFVHPDQRGIERTCRSTRLLPVHAPIVHVSQMCTSLSLRTNCVHIYLL